MWAPQGRLCHPCTRQLKKSPLIFRVKRSVLVCRRRSARSSLYTSGFCQSTAKFTQKNSTVGLVTERGVLYPEKLNSIPDPSWSSQHFRLCCYISKIWEHRSKFRVIMAIVAAIPSLLKRCQYSHQSLIQTILFRNVLEFQDSRKSRSLASHSNGN